MVILSRFVAPSVSLIQHVSLFQPSTFPTFGPSNTVRELWPPGSEDLHDAVETDSTGAACFPLVTTNPRTGRKALVVSAVALDTLSETLDGEGSLGWERSQELVEELLRPALSSVYFHPWRAGDFVICEKAECRESICT